MARPRELRLPSRPPARPGRRLAVALLLAALAAWLGWAQLPGRSLLAFGTPATGAAEWIWIDGPHDRRSPVAFYAVRDVALDAVPPGVELRVLADEEYHAFVNGRWVGAGAWSPGAPLDAYAVASLLRKGSNRILFEVRSARGSGGLLACLVDPRDGRVLAATGESWQTLQRHHDELFQGWARLGPAHGTRSWGRPPTGRWGAPEPGPPRPALEPRGRKQRVPPTHLRLLGDPDGWRPFRALGKVPRALRGRSGPGYEIDFGAPVAGRLNLRLAEDPGLRTALLFFDDAPRRFPPLEPFPAASADDPGGAHGPPQASAIVIPGRPGWSDVAARRFRYVAVIGEVELLEAWIDPPAPWEEPLPPAACAPCEGLLGIEPPPLRTPVQDEVGRQLERFTRVAGR